MTDPIAEELRKPFPPSLIGKLPKAGRQLDFVGHGPVTDRLLKADPEWTWAPMGYAPDGSPAFIREDGHLILWGWLTVGGVMRPGVGVVRADKEDAHKEVISDFLKNAAMRFGVALDLWINEDTSAQAKPAAKRKPPVDIAGDAEHQALRLAVQNLTPDKQRAFKEWRVERGMPAFASAVSLTTEQIKDALTHVNGLAVQENDEAVERDRKEAASTGSLLTEGAESAPTAVAPASPPALGGVRAKAEAERSTAELLRDAGMTT